MNILITGGCGFIGSNLATFLKEKNPSYNIICLDNLKRRGSELNIKRLKQRNIKFVHGDIRNIEDIKSVGNFDLLLECSAEPSIHAGYGNDPSYLINTNLVGTLNCLETVRKNKSSVIFLSTSRVYPIKSIQNLPYEERETRITIPEDKNGTGWSFNGISEKFTLEGIRSLYGASKLCSEMMIQEYSFAYGINGVINRCGVVAGPWQMGKVDQGFVSLWMAAHLLDNKQLSYNGFGGKGIQVRDVLHIKDLCSLIQLQINNIDVVNGKTYNIGGGINNSISLVELTNKCREITGNSINITTFPETKPFDIPWYITDNTLIKSDLGWEPLLSINTTLSDIKEWILETKESLKSIFD